MIVFVTDNLNSFTQDLSYIRLLLSYAAQLTKLIFSIWGHWHQTILERQVLSFSVPPYAWGREQASGKNLNCSASNRSNHLAMAPRAANYLEAFCLTAWKLNIPSSSNKFLMKPYLIQKVFEPTMKL